MTAVEQKEKDGSNGSGQPSIVTATTGGSPSVQVTTPAEPAFGTGLSLNPTICCRVILQQIELTAAAAGMQEKVIESRLAACISVLTNNGFNLSDNLDSVFIRRLALAIAGTDLAQVPGLILLNVGLSIREAIADLLRGYAECLASRSKDQQLTAPQKPLEKAQNYEAKEQSTAVERPSTESEKQAITPPVAPMAVTYGTLITAHQKRARGKLDKKTIQNQVSALRRLMTILGENEAAECGWLADHRQFKKRLVAAEIVDPSFRSALNGIRETACAVVALANPATRIYESYLQAYHKFINMGGKAELLGVNAFIKLCFNATGMPRARLNAPKIPVYGATFERVAELENSLRAEGELTRWLINMSDDNAQRFKTDYQKRVSEAVQFEYAFQWEEWPEGLKQEWSELLLLRTEPIRASAKWDLHLENLKKKKLPTWRVRKSDGACPSADNRLHELEWFFGWSQLPKSVLPNGTKNLWRSGPDKPLTKEQLSLALLTDQDLTDGYLDFRKAHTLTEQQVMAGQQGTFNRSCRSFLEFISSLMSPTTGFIYLRKEVYFRPDDTATCPKNIAARVGFKFLNQVLGKYVEVTDPDERWLYFCNRVRSYVEVRMSHEFDPTVATRDKAPILKILALDDPMAAVAELLYALDNAEPCIPYWRHFHRRKKLFFKLISECPLRVFQFALMTGKHLKKGDEGFYKIHFKKDEFKNERFIRELDYTFNVPQEFTSFIDDYLANEWPALNGRPFTEGDQVFSAFRPSKTASPIPLTQKQINERIIQELQKMCKHTTARHLGAKYQTPGFGPHAFRHIKGTAVIKQTGSFEAAALLLWDSVKTVRLAYSHVKRVDQLARVSRDDHERTKALVEKLQGV